MEEVLDAAAELFSHSLAQVAVTITVALTLQLIAHASIGRIVHRTVRSHRYDTKLDEEKREETLIKIFRTFLAVVLWTIVIIVILMQLDVNIAALATGAGLIGIVVGFGAQTTIKDFLAGIFIIMENQYRVGDIVVLNSGANNVDGIVEDITIRITRLRDLDGNLHIVANGSVSVVTNLTFKYANVNVDVGVSYDADVDKVEKVINDVGQKMAEDEDWKQHIFEPIQFLRVDAFEDSAVRIKALGKVEPASQWDIAGEFRRRIKKAFEKNNIAVPYRQIIVHQEKIKK